VSRPTLLVSQRLVACQGHDEVRECLDRRWGSFLGELGVLPIPLAMGAGVDAYVEQLQPAGVLLTGGNDLSSVGGDALSRERDAFELALLEAARARELPVLGVCRGMQLLCEQAGFAIEACPGHVATQHGLEPAEVARHSALREPRLANSYHQFAARPRPGSKLRVVLRSLDGVAEAVEHPSQPVVGIMWHPERYAAPRGSDLELFRQVFGL
jgi:N5-(cytidine 5'-diphosphoramidyl)-L-glutamine hydrolase